MTAHKTVFTSFSQDGYELYGRRFMETFEKHWPAEVGLSIYHEWDDFPEDLPAGTDKRIRYFRHVDQVDGLKPFLDAVSHFPLLRGEQTTEKGQVYNIQTDARMARKTFIEADAAERHGGKVFWVDADVITHADVPEDFLDEVLPDDKMCCYLGREKVYTESGFLGYNTDHGMCEPFLRLYRGLFESGAFLTLQGFHDCWAFDAARRGVEDAGHDIFHNLGAGVDPGPGLQVFLNQPLLGKYLDHLKGARKGKTRSPSSDLTIERTEPHWQTPEPEPYMQTR